MKVSALVRREVRARFSPEAASVVERLLAETDLVGLDVPSRDRERDRVQLAALKMADGDLAALREALALGALDWRDLLMSAGLENLDWPTVLRAAGYLAP